MDIAELDIRHAAAVGLFRNIHPAGPRRRPAPAALAAAAARGRGDTGTLSRDKKRLIRGGGGIILLAALDDCELEGPAADLRGVVGLVPRILYHAEKLTAHELAPQAELGDLRVEEVVHGLRAAHEYAVLLAAVFFL